MQEAIGMAAMTETPLVVVDVMRAGPSTGLPTKTAQGDLNMVLGISQDDFPRVILAPRSPQEAFFTAGRAFNIAEKYQLPVIVLMDFAIGDGGYATVENLTPQIPIERGKIVKEAPPDMHNGVWFKRYALTEDGVSPRSLPGTPNLMFVAKTDEHDEFGHDLSDVLAGLREAVEMRRKQFHKRMIKLQSVLKELNPPEVFGPDRADLTIVTWGSSSLPVREALEKLWEEGFKVNSYEFYDIYPFPAGAESMLKQASDLMDVEQNYTGQMAKLIRRETGILIEKSYLKYDGEPIYPIEVVNAVKKHLNGGR